MLYDDMIYDFFFFFMTWLPMIFFFSHTRDKSQAEIIFCLNCWIIDAKHCAEIADWSRRGSNHDKPVQIQIHMCYTLCACNINGGEVYLLPSRAAASAVIGAVCSRLLHFHCSLPSLVPTHLHLRFARRGSRSPVAALTTTVPPPLSFGGYSLCYYLSSQILSWYTAGAQSSLVWSRSFFFLFFSRAGPLSVEVSVCLFRSQWESSGGKHHWCRLHPLERRQDGVDKAASVPGFVLSGGEWTE